MSSLIRLQQNSDELISDEVNEIMSYRPHWIIRKGNIVFLVVILLLISLTWFIKYPDIVSASAKLVAINAPKLIIANSEGKLEKILIENEKEVQAGEYLAYLQSTAKHEQVIRLNNWIVQMIEAYQLQKLNALTQHPLPSFLQLGELQNAYQDFENVFVETKQLLSTGYYQKKKAALQKDLHYLSELKNSTYEQKKIIQQDQQLQKKNTRLMNLWKRIK